MLRKSVSPNIARDANQIALAKRRDQPLSGSLQFDSGSLPNLAALLIRIKGSSASDQSPERLKCSAAKVLQDLKIHKSTTTSLHTECAVGHGGSATTCRGCSVLH